MSACSIDRLIHIRDAAERLGITRSHLQGWLRFGIVQSTYQRRHANDAHRFTQAEMDALEIVAHVRRALPVTMPHEAWQALWWALFDPPARLALAPAGDGRWLALDAEDVLFDAAVVIDVEGIRWDLDASS